MPQQRWSREQISRQLKDAEKECQLPLAEEDERAAQKNYTRIVGRAIRAGMLDNPKVREWIEGQRTSGNYHALRKFKIGIEADVMPTASAPDVWIALQSADLIEKGNSLNDIREELRLLLEAKDRLDWFNDDPFIVNGIKTRLSTKQRLQQVLAQFDMSTAPERRDSLFHD